jgi:flagellar biosynthesis protein FlhB
MAGEDQENDDKTEAPTPRRLEKARTEGRAPVSRELPGFVGLVGATLALAVIVPPAGAALAHRLAAWLALPPEATLASASGLLAATLWPLLALVLGTALLILAPAMIAQLLQTGFLVSAAQMAPKLSKISPLAGAKRLVSADNLVEFLKSLAKFLILGGAAWWVLAGDIGRLQSAAEWPVQALLHIAGDEVQRVLIAVLAALAVLTILDVAWTRWHFTSQLRMSRQDLREEHKDSEGDPHLKAKLRRIRQERARTRMMAEVKTAAVVVTNPTHYAVALAYERGTQAAPTVVAKGVDAVAARIRAEAEKHGIPLYPDPPLARALYPVDLGSEIPTEHYQAVAEVIAFVWKLRNRASGKARADG